MTWEERWYPLREEWIIVAAHRQHRPWNGEMVECEEAVLPAYQDGCYLCPGNERVSGRRNDVYASTFVFDNDHPCVGFNAPQELTPPAGNHGNVFRNRPATGISRVVCYSPQHNVCLLYTS